MAKTLDEALDMLSTNSGRSAVAVLDVAERYKGFISELLSSERVAALIGATLAQAIQTNEDIEMTMFSAFFSGFVVAMEMEKQELAGGTAE